MPRPTPRPTNAGTSADFQTGGTPQPFGVESTGSAPSLQPLNRPGAPIMPPSVTTQPIVVAKRSVFWPIFGVLMVLIAGGALFLVWQQTQKPQTPSEIKITQEPAVKLDPPPGTVQVMKSDPPATPDANAGSTGDGSARGSATVVEKPKTVVKPKPFKEQIGSAVSARLSDLMGCFNQHPADMPAKGTSITAQVAIGTNGRTKTVSLLPTNLDASPLGGCLKNVLKRTEFPKGQDTSFQIPLSLRGN
jgi:hypothetical protein